MQEGRIATGRGSSFPQLKGLGSSATSAEYGISYREEAAVYLKHAVLGDRLRECTRKALEIDASAEDIFGYPDWLKFRSCMTLFAAVSGEPLFYQALDKFFDGESDKRTLQLLNHPAHAQAYAPASGRPANGSIRCSPHSVFEYPDQRPALGSSSGRTARVQWVQPMLG